MRGMGTMSTSPNFPIMSLEMKLQLAPVSIIALHRRLACFGLPTATRMMNCFVSFITSWSADSLGDVHDEVLR